MKMDEMFPSSYLKASDLPPMKPIKLTISDVQMHSFTDNDTGQKNDKPVIFFAGKEKGMTLNWGNAQLLFSQIAPDSDDWIGAEICVYNDPNVMMGKKRVGGLRFSIPEHSAPIIDSHAQQPRAIQHQGNGQAAPAQHQEPVYDSIDEVPF